MSHLPPPPAHPGRGLRSWFRRVATRTTATLQDGAVVELKPVADATGSCRWVGSATVHVNCGGRWVGATARVTLTAIDSTKWTEDTTAPPPTIPQAR